MKKQYDIIIAGGGPSGVCAAIAAARHGSSVLIVEQYSCLGGMSTMGLVSPWMTFHDLQGKQVIFGIPQEIVDNLIEKGMSPGHVPDTMGETSTITPFDNDGLKLVLQEMCQEAKVHILYHSFFFETVTHEREITGIRIINKNGISELSAKVFIDATGDGDLFALSGCSYVKGRSSDGKMQPMSMMFNMIHVDFQKVQRYMQEHHDEFHNKTKWEQLNDLPNSVSGFFSLWKKGCKEMGLSIERDRLLFFRGYRDDIANVNTTRVLGKDPTDAEELTCAELESRKQVYSVAALLKRYVPGFENAIIMNVAPVTGIREGRRLTGRYILTGDDLMTGRMHEDNVAIYAYPIDQHDPDGGGFREVTVPQYGIPYRSLLPKEYDNLLVSGKCISATREAQSSFRLTPGAMVTGQAAGTAAALAIRTGGGVPDVNIGLLQKTLRQDNVYL